MAGITVRELLGLRNIGTTATVAGQITATGDTPVEVPLPSGAQTVVLLRIGIFGVATLGTVSYDVTNGNQSDSGYAINDYIDTFIPYGGPLTVTISSQQASGVVYTLLYAALTFDQYKSLVSCVS